MIPPKRTSTILRPVASVLLLAVAFPTTTRAERFLVRDGKPMSRIVIAEAPERTVRLAAAESQKYIEKITGARLPIATAPVPDAVSIYIGRSPHTDRLGISTKDLKYGAYRIASGNDWLALIGDDSDFTPREPWARSHSDWNNRVRAEWDRLTGGKWGNPGASRLYKDYLGKAWNFGKPETKQSNERVENPVWAYDERGSFNGVCGLLRRLGVRWYLPGELGEVVPSRSTVELPKIDETVHPDFPIRRFNFRFRVQPPEVAMWAMRLGVRDPYDVWVPHGMARVTERDAMKAAHPEYYALYGGKRATDRNQLCLSCEGLLHENVRFLQKVFDIYGFSVASVMPNDGYTAMCQCPLCEGKDTPERGYRGRLSDYVWDYVNRVAKGIEKTHPDKKIVCCAYGPYRDPPLKIEKLRPNVLVCIVGGRRPTQSKPEQRQEIRELRRGWLEKTDNPILIFENYPFTDRGWYLPSYVPHVLGESINATKGVSQGEEIWLSLGHDFEVPGYNHFNVYFTARMYWGGQRDVDALFAEYCRLFYGPAENAMKAFFEYCEQNWQDMQTDKEKIDRALGLFAAAERKADADSVYGRRVALVGDYLVALRNRGEQLAKERGPVPSFRPARDAKNIRIDGRLDEAFWQTCPTHATGRLRELQTGRRPVFGTTFQAAWGRDGLYVAVRCEEMPGDKVNVGTEKDEDPALWYGDVVEILLETDSHSYYQIAVNPSGAVADLDRKAPKHAWFRWDSQAEVATHVADDHWTVEMRIPVVAETNDPLHQVVGRKPTDALPWYFNVCRQRQRENGVEHSAFSPTGTATFHEIRKFAKLYLK